MKQSGTWNGSYAALAVLIIACLVYVGIGGATHTSRGETQAETAPPPPGKEIATFAAGCFWSMQAMFQQIKGVERVNPGYAGGHVPHPSYEQVEEGDTGYAEAVNIVFDPKVVSYHQLLQVLLIARDPTTLNQQGNDVGTNYRSVIYYHGADQREAAQNAIHEVSISHIWQDPIVTTVEPFSNFYRAEDYHINYYNLHPNEPYCAQVITPELAKFPSQVSVAVEELMAGAAAACEYRVPAMGHRVAGRRERACDAIAGAWYAAQAVMEIVAVQMISST